MTLSPYFVDEGDEKSHPQETHAPNVSVHVIKETCVNPYGTFIACNVRGQSWLEILKAPKVLYHLSNIKSFELTSQPLTWQTMASLNLDFLVTD